MKGLANTKNISCHILSYHIIYCPHKNFIYYQNIQIYCINTFLILNNKIHIGFWNEEELTESHYDLVNKSLFGNRVLQTHGWNVLEVCNFTAKRSLNFNLDLKNGSDSIFFLRNLEKVISDGGPSKWYSEFAFAKCSFTVKLWKIFWVSMRDFLKTSWKY